MCEGTSSEIKAAKGHIWYGSTQSTASKTFACFSHFFTHRTTTPTLLTNVLVPCVWCPSYEFHSLCWLWVFFQYIQLTLVNYEQHLYFVVMIRQQCARRRSCQRWPIWFGWTFFRFVSPTSSVQSFLSLLLLSVYGTTIRCFLVGLSVPDDKHFNPKR